MKEFLAGRVVLYPGDCLETLTGLPEASVDACVTDPPYHLTSIVKRFGADGAAPVKIRLTESQAGSPFERGARGFMGKKWDGGDIAFRPETWAAVARVLKPGAHLVAFGAPKNYHRLACAIEDAGFEVRDSLMWLFGSGFPKSHNAGNGWGTALKPAYEPIILARKPLIGTVAKNVEAHGVGALNINDCRIEGVKGTPASPRRAAQNATYGDLSNDPGTGSGWDPNVGRWPANIVHDGSEEVVAMFPERDGATSNGKTGVKGVAHEGYGGMDQVPSYADSGSAARFFYTAKADSNDRIASKHPTVKPVDLMRWLVRLVTPAGGLVLDPFAGTGTTGEAAALEGARAILMEAEPEYQADIERRMALVMAGPDERSYKIAKAKDDGSQEIGPLFNRETT